MSSSIVGSIIAGSLGTAAFVHPTSLRSRLRPTPPSHLLAQTSDYHHGNVLSAEGSMFKRRSSSSAKCTWPILTVEPQHFSFAYDNDDIHLPSQISPRAFEYGSSWVEHYYSTTITECRARGRMGVIRALYQWYIAQFTLDYIHEEVSITADQFRYASFLSDDDSCLNGVDPQLSLNLEGCRSLMSDYTGFMKSELSPDVYDKVKEGTDGFFQSSIDQINGDDCLVDDMSFDDYVRFRAVNAGGLFGFIEQCHFFQIFYTDDPLPQEVLSSFAHNVGLHISLLNDLYGLERDEDTGDLNIILKYADDSECTAEEAIEWAVIRLQRCAVNVYELCEKHPQSIPSKHNIAMSCISGNHGFHDGSKRYKLPKGFQWPDDCLVDYSLEPM